MIYHLDKDSFVRLTVIDDYIKRDQDLYLYEEVDRLNRDTTAEILFAWKPTQRNTFFIGAKAGATDVDELDRPRTDETAVYIKYSRAFRY